MAEIAIDANVIVGHLYAADAQHGRAEQLLDRLEVQGHEVVLLDVLVQLRWDVACSEQTVAPPTGAQEPGPRLRYGLIVGRGR
jgi:hypothetical protein